MDVIGRVEQGAETESNAGSKYRATKEKGGVVKNIRIKRREFLQLTAATGLALSSPFHVFSAESLPKRKIPSTGEPLPIMGLGNSQAFRNGDLEVSRTIVNILLQMGGSVIDTRGNSTLVLGKLMQELNADLFLLNNISAMDKAEGLQQIQQAKTVQGKDKLDVIQITNFRDINTQWKNMLAWKEAGHARYIGVAIAFSNMYGPLEALMKTGSMDFVQINYSMLEPKSGERLLPLASEKDIAVITNRPFINGNYFSLVKDKPLPKWTADFDCHSWAQFSLKWILSNPIVNCVLTETANPKHAIDNLNAGFGRLPDKNQRIKMLNFLKSM